MVTRMSTDHPRRWMRVMSALGFTMILLVTGAGAAYAGHALVQADGDHLHWADSDPSFPRGYVYWKDETGSEWPVYSSAIKWDEEPRLDAVYTTGSCTSSHCVTVREANLSAGCSAPYGETDIPAGAAGHFTTNVEVRIDAQCDSRATSHRRELVCHELGHSIGLDERPSTSSTCMRTGNMNGSQLPDSHDFQVLHNSYNHND